MARPHKRIVRVPKRGPLENWKTAFLLTGTIDEDDPEINPYIVVDWTHEYPRANNRPAFALWQEVQGDLMPYWIDRHPGTRPFAWWRYEAPEQRKQVGGKATELPLYLRYEFGLPISWLRSAYQEDLPLFESEAAYLDRLEMITDAERSRLSTTAYEPVLLMLDPEQLVSDTFTRSALHEYASKSHRD